MVRSSSLESLESRIAPAVIFVSGSAAAGKALKVFTETGGNAQDTAMEMDARLAVGATKVVSLAAGDSLVFDRNGNHHTDPADYLMMQVDTGNAMVFLTNGNTGSNPGAFDLTEITGIATSGTFGATINVDVNGPILTALSATGTIEVVDKSITIYHGSIDGLTVKGQVLHGGVLAGGSIENATFGARLFNQGTPQISVDGNIATGSAVAIRPPDQWSESLQKFVSLNGGVKNFGSFLDSHVPGESGGNIAHITLPFGADAIIAGYGFNGAGSVSGGSGGSLIDIHVAKGKRVMQILAGNGGAASDVAVGGSGGSISDSTFILAPTADPHSAVVGGYGTFVGLGTGAGGSSQAGAGGNGGNLNHVSLKVLTPVLGVAIYTAQGGLSGTNPSQDGSIKDLQLSLPYVVGFQRAPRQDDTDTNGVRIWSTGDMDGLALKLGAASAGDREITVGGDLTNSDIQVLGSIPNLSIKAHEITGLAVHNSGTLNLLNFEAPTVSNLSLINSGIIDKILVTSRALSGGVISGLVIENSGVIWGGTIQTNPWFGSVNGIIQDVTITGSGRIGNLGSPLFLSTVTAEVHNVQFDAPNGSFWIGAISTNVFYENSAVPQITHIVGTVSRLKISAAAGISGSNGTAGRDGGSISDVHIKATSGTVQQIVAGNGGKGSGSAAGGVGGSISDVQIDGDIGIHTAGYGFNPIRADGFYQERMGGLAVGRGGAAGPDSADDSPGLNGTIANVSAKRIAAIVAGTDTKAEFGYQNAVRTISNLVATELGANVSDTAALHEKGTNGARFDFRNPSTGTDGKFQPNSMHEPDDGDFPLDGLVMVQAGGLLTPLPVIPLKLVEV